MRVMMKLRGRRSGRWLCSYRVDGKMNSRNTD